MRSNRKRIRRTKKRRRKKRRPKAKKRKKSCRACFSRKILQWSSLTKWPFITVSSTMLSCSRPSNLTSPDKRKLLWQEWRHQLMSLVKLDRKILIFCRCPRHNFLACRSCRRCMRLSLASTISRGALWLCSTMRTIFMMPASGS